MILGMPDIKVLGIVRITYEVLNSQQAGRKVDFQITQPTHTIKCKTHTVKGKEQVVGMPLNQIMLTP